MESAADTSLGPLLDTVAADAQRESAAARTEIMREFAAALLHARRHAPCAERAGIIRALKERQQAALSLARRKAALDLLGRQQALIQARRGRASPSLHRSCPTRPNLLAAQGQYRRRRG